jgi:CRP/FNR family transcriptional regulator
VRRIQCETCSVRDSGTLCDLPPEAREEFRAIGQLRMYKARQVIFGEGNPSDGLYLVCHGNVKLYHSDRFGRDHILEVAGPGAVLGEFMPADGQTMSLSAEALTEAQLSFLPHNTLAAFVQKYPAGALRLIENLGRQLAATRRKTRELALKSGEGRLASLLLQLCPAAKSGSTVTLPYRRHELADMIGVSTETAIRLLGKLKAKGTIDTQRRTLRIVDLEKLTRIAQQEEL